MAECDDWLKIESQSGENMRYFILTVAIGIAAWLAFSYVDFSSSESVKVYWVDEADTPNSDVSRPRPSGVSRYKIQGNNVIVQGGFDVSKFENCKIFNKTNWRCQYKYEDGTFGLQDGLYISTGPYDTPKQVSRFRYVMTSCQWFFKEDIWSGVKRCFLLPFSL